MSQGYLSDVPRFRQEISALRPYQVGRQLEEVARENGLDPSELIKLTANEGPDGPFPGVVEAVTSVLGQSNRYPDNDCWTLGHALADELDVGFSDLLFGAGSVALLAELVLATGGPDTNIVYGWPSFVMYRFAAIWAGSSHREVPLDSQHRLDLAAMADAIDEETRVVIVCNPNNPTGTIRSGEDIRQFIEGVPDSVLVVVDEAYHEFVEADEYETLVPLAVERDNVIVLRTFSKIYGLAGYRVGYAVGRPETLAEIRKVQAPLTVNFAGQVAAHVSLGQADELARRREENSAHRHHLTGALAERGIDFAESHTNFIYFHLGDEAERTVEAMTGLGVVIRPMSGGWVRVTIGSADENRRFLEVLDEVRSDLE